MMQKKSKARLDRPSGANGGGSARSLMPSLPETLSPNEGPFIQSKALSTVLYQEGSSNQSSQPRNSLEHSLTNEEPFLSPLLPIVPNNPPGIDLNASTKVVSQGNTFTIGGSSNQNSFHYGPNIYVGQQAGPHTLDPSIHTLKRSHNAEYDMVTNTNRGPCTPRTRTVILDKLINWGKSKGAMLYWMSGMAGTGKTTIGYSVCERLAELNILGASFFCSRSLPDCRDANIIIPTIAFQLARRCAPFGEALAAVLRDDTDILQRGLHVQLRKLIIEPWMAKKQELPLHSVVVLDALDECDDHHAKFLQILFAHAAALPIKILITSRPEFSIRDTMKAKDPRVLSTFILHEVESDLVREDIARYLESELSDRTTSAVIEYLTDLCGSLFIFAATLVRFLKARSANFVTRLELLKKSLPPDTKMKMMASLDMLYKGVLSAAFHSDLLENEAQEIREVLFTIVCARDPLTREGIAILWCVAEEEVDRRLESLHSVIFIPRGRNHPLTVFHASFPDFMQDPARSEQFCCQPYAFNLEIAKQCLALMNRELHANLCRLVWRQPNDLIDPHIICQYITPGLQYAVVYWIEHWELAGRSQRRVVLNSIREFLTTHTLHWFECLSLAGVLSVSIPSLEALLNGLDEDTNLTNLAHNSLRFVQQVYDLIKYNAMETYYSALAWIPSHSPLRIHYATLCEKSPQVLCGTATSWTGPDQTINIHIDNVSFVAVSQDGHRIISESDGRIVRIWNMRSSVEESVFHSIATSGDGSCVVVGSQGGVQVCQTTTKAVILTLKTLGPISAITTSRNKKYVAIGHTDDLVHVWDATTGCLVRTLEDTHLVSSITFMSGNIHLVSASHDEFARVWDVTTGRMDVLRGHAGSIWSVASSPVGGKIATVSADGTARLWSRWGRELQVLRGHSDSVRSAAFMPNGRRVVTGSDDKTLRIWDVTSGATLHVFEGLAEAVRSVAVFPDGQKVVSCSGKTMSIWSLRGGDEMKVDTSPLNVEAKAMAFSFNGRKVLLLPSLRILDITNLEEKTISHSQDSVYGYGAFSTLGNMVAVIMDQVIEVWGLAGDGIVEHKTTLKGHTNEIQSFSFSHNDSQIASASWDRTVRVWDVVTGKQNHILNHSYFVYSVAFSHDDTRIISTTVRAINIWDAQSGEQLHHFSTHVDSATFTPDDQHIIISYRSTIELWNAKTCRLEYTHQRYRHWTTFNDGSSFALSADGQWICHSSRLGDQPRQLLWIPSQYQPTFSLSPAKSGKRETPVHFAIGPLFTTSSRGVQVCLPRQDGLVTLMIPHNNG